MSSYERRKCLDLRGQLLIDYECELRFAMENGSSQKEIEHWKTGLAALKAGENPEKWNF